jgi:polyphosphate:AMP phosphotransferase
MFEIAELGHSLKKEEYKKQIPGLRTQLLSVQQQLAECDFPVFIIISGVDGSGKGEIINLLNEWMDPRYIRTNAFGKPSDEERDRPRMWRFWRSMPKKGEIGIYVGSWYSRPIAKRVKNKINQIRLKIELNKIKRFERELIDDGALMVKCWLHLDKATQRKRLKELEKNPQTRWRVTKRDKKHLKIYDQFIQVAETVLKTTSSIDSPWLIVDSHDEHYRNLTVGQHVLQRISHHVEQYRRHRINDPEFLSSASTADNQRCLLDALDLSKNLSEKIYSKKLNFYQEKLGRLAREAHKRKISSILVFEGWDAAGKGGAVRRLTRAMDARNYQVIRIAAPTDEERLHHYLWRFWRHLPRAGKATLYDRSWYGRVLVERVEGFASKMEWLRAYSEIVNFEEDLAEHGIILLKFWLHIDKEEQFRRFKERETISYKRYKITEEDYRNREKWQDYEIAANDMFARTSSHASPWVLVEANDKRFARIKILKKYCGMLEQKLEA